MCKHVALSPSGKPLNKKGPFWPVTSSFAVRDKRQLENGHQLSNPTTTTLNT